MKYITAEDFTPEELQTFKDLWKVDRQSAVDLLKEKWIKDPSQQIIGSDIATIVCNDEKYVRAQLNKYGLGYFNRLSAQVVNAMQTAISNM